MVYRPRRKRNIYTSPENKIKAVERVLARTHTHKTNGRRDERQSNKYSTMG